jgi:hypothetical protein
MEQMAPLAGDGKGEVSFLARRDARNAYHGASHHLPKREAARVGRRRRYLTL